LASNGGLTLTHALLTDSPAIDAGDNTGAPTTDQRGATRPKDGDGSAIVDIGAFEKGRPRSRLARSGEAAQQESELVSEAALLRTMAEYLASRKEINTSHFA
jgi:hypothetical protein